MFDFQTFLQNVLLSEGLDMGMWYLIFLVPSNDIVTFKLTDVKSDQPNFVWSMLFFLL